MRGCSDRAEAPHVRRQVLPADAGVFRRRGRHPEDHPRPPRRCGGVPPAPGEDSPKPRSSPPMRGCSARSERELPRGPVLPADAGVFRTTAPPTSPRPRPPRRCGGVPPASIQTCRTCGSSPPMRGCSAQQGRSSLPAGVLPADAGVFRRTAGRWPGRPGPPRRCGGVPMVMVVLPVPPLSSPPMRGCSGRRRPGACRRPGPPADARAFRSDCSTAGLSSGARRVQGQRVARIITVSIGDAGDGWLCPMSSYPHDR